jgi:predicted dehydrogenase
MKKIGNKIYNRLFLSAHAGDINVAIAGVGGWGGSNAIELMRTKEFKIRAVFDIDLSKAKKFAEIYKVKVYKSYLEILNDKQIDAVVISVPNQFHFEMCTQALEAHKHVFIEKPLAENKEQCIALDNLSKKNKLTLMVGYQVRREFVFRKIKEVVNKNLLGKPVFAQGVRTIKRDLKNDWRGDPFLCPYGSIEQLGVHLIDVMIYLFGQPMSWISWGKNINLLGYGPDLGHVEMSFKNGVIGMIETSFSSPSVMYFSIFFDEGQIVYNGNKLKIINKSCKIQNISIKGKTGSYKQFKEFADCILNSKVPETNAKSSSLISEILASTNLN